MIDSIAFTLPKPDSLVNDPLVHTTYTSYTSKKAFRSYKRKPGSAIVYSLTKLLLTPNANRVVIVIAIHQRKEASTKERRQQAGT